MSSPRRRRGPWGAILALAPLLLILVAASTGQRADAQADPAVVGQWSAVMNWPVVAIHSHLLPNGKVLFWDRFGGEFTKLWDPIPNTFTDVPLNGTNLFCSGSSFLRDGRLHVSGGHIEDGVGRIETHLFDWHTNTWTRVGDMNAGRWYPANCTLANGDVVVTSGSIDNNVGGNSLPQVWSNQAGWRSLTDAQMYLPLYPYLHLAPDGKGAFMSGPGQGSWYLDTAGTGQWSYLADSHEGYRDYGGSVMYDSGKILLLGGHDPPVASAEVINLNDAEPAWRLVGNMANARRQCSSLLLADGKVLVTGGSSAGGFNNADGGVFAAELWDPATEQFTTMASAAERRLYHSTTLLLPDGRVLSAGGGQPAGGGDDADHLTAEIYSPPYLFKGARPTITAAPDRVTWGETFAVSTPDGASIQNVHLIALTSVTHTNNQNQRINKLAFTTTAGGLNVTAPPSANVCVPGYYMLFILNQQGVPSVARMIRVDSLVTTPPAAPSALTAKAISNSHVDLSWVDGSNNEDGFQIVRRQEGPFAPIATVGSNMHTYADIGLAANTVYIYRVRAYNDAGNSLYSNQQSVKTLPIPPIGTGNGLLGSYFDNMDFTAPKVNRTDARVNFDWGNGLPASGMGADTFSVRWTGQIQPRFSEVYTFTTTSDDGVRLWVNGQLIINNWTDHAPTDNTGAIALKAGTKYSIKLEFYENGGGAVAKLFWSCLSQAKQVVTKAQLYSPAPPPVVPGGLEGKYYDTATFTTLKVTRTDPTLNFNWGGGSPAPSLGADTFSTRWTGFVTPEFDGSYNFIATSDDGVRVWVNGQQIINSWTNAGLRETSGSITLTAGQRYPIRVDYYENTGSASMKLEWESAGQGRQVVPQGRLAPH